MKLNFDNLYTLEEYILPKELFGEYINSGKDHDVYEYAKDPNKVIKIVKNSYFSKTYMFKCLTNDRFNEVPCIVKKELLGYLTIKNEYYPVWIQDKVSNTLKTRDTEAYKKLANTMIDNGFFPYSFISDKFCIYDLHPRNIVDSEELAIVDCYTSIN